MDDEELGPSPVVSVPLKIEALDGFELGAELHRLSCLQDPPTVVLFSCGGGIPASRYSRFARYLAANGIPVLTFDYRGIATSSGSTLRGFKAVAEDWSELDCGGAIRYLRTTYPKSEIVGIAHSIGALLIGGAPNVASISRFVFLCAHTGYYADYLPAYRLPMAIMWHAVMPLLTRVFGYFPAKHLGLGENIPAGIALQWAARRSPEFQPEATDPASERARAMISRYESVRGRALAMGFTDDAFATPAGTSRLLRTFPSLNATDLVISPRQVAMPEIGHFGFFRRAGEANLWPIVLKFVSQGQ